MQVTDQRITEFVNYLFETLPFKQINGSNKDGIKAIVNQLIRDLYTVIPEDVINFLEKNASDYFLDILYREAGISDYHIKRIPQNLKVRISYLLNNLNINRTTQAVFKLFHEAIEEFFPKLNIYLIEVVPRNLNSTENFDLIYRLEPRYITDPDSLIEEIDITELSGTFLMRPDQFIDREEKFSHLYPDYKSKQRIINIFPIKTGIIYVQNPNGLGHADFDDYIPLMQTIGASLQQYNNLPWKTDAAEKRVLINFIDFIKLCTYLKYKEFEFKSTYMNPGQPKWTWKTEPLEIYGNVSKFNEWNLALFQSKENGISWNNYFTTAEYKLNEFLLDKEDLDEAMRLEVVYKGLKRSGKSNGYRNLEQFKTDWNTLRQKHQNVSIRRISNQKEFRDELVGLEPFSMNELEVIMLFNFESNLYGAARNSILQAKKIYNTDTNNTKGQNGIITYVNKFFTNEEFNKFIYTTYSDVSGAPDTELELFIDLFNWYLNSGTIPLLKNYFLILRDRFPELLNLPLLDPYRESIVIVKKIIKELFNDANLPNFQELNNKINIKYRSIVEKIDALSSSPGAGPESYTAIFLLLWKLIQNDISDDKRVRYFWNEFFMRHIMGSTFKDFFYDPIMDLFLEYWFPAESSTQNKDIQTLLIKDKMQTIPLNSNLTCELTLNKMDKTLCKDQHKISIFKLDGTTEVHDYMFKVIPEREYTVTINN